MKLPKKLHNNKNVNVILGFLSGIFLVIAVVLFPLGFNRQVDAANSSYYTSLDVSYNEAKNKAYDHFFEVEEEKNHVTNEVSISVSDIKQEERLEVLYVSDVDYQINNSGGTTIWTMLPGVGTFTVNLKSAEFIVDNEQKYVLARVPRPELSDFSIDRENVKVLLSEDGFFNGNYGKGEDIAREDYDNAYRNLKNKIQANNEYKQQAETSAEFIIKNLITAVNSDVDGLTIDVEFLE